MTVAHDVAAVIVDFHAGSALARCVTTLRADGVARIVVVENGDPGTARDALGEDLAEIVEPGVNLGYGRAVNRGAARVGDYAFLLVSNPDIEVHAGAVATLVDFLDDHPDVAVVGPTIERPDGTVYPSHRIFPNVALAALHALLAPLWPSNPATRRYRSPRPDGAVDWISGAFFLVRRDVFETVGGFDERYFMFAEDMALCWAVREAGYSVAAVPAARVTHQEGLSRARAPRAMVRAHHASALRFEWQTARGARRLFAPLASLVLGVRLALILLREGRSGSRGA